MRPQTKASRRTGNRRPFVFVNMIMTADGKITTANRKVTGFGSRRDQEHMMELRAQADAVMAGARTADEHPVTLGPGGARYRRLRAERGLSPYNLRVIVSGTASIDPEAEIFRHKFSPVLVLTTEVADPARVARLRGLAAEVKVCGANQIDFAAALAWLRDAWKVKRLLCEGGGEINDALFRADLVDELHLTICPRIFGGRTAPTIAGGLGAASLGEATRLKLKSSRRCGDELFLVYTVLREPNRCGRQSRPTGAPMTPR